MSAKGFLLLLADRGTLRDVTEMLEHWNLETILEVSRDWEEFYKPVASLKKIDV